MHRFLVAVTFLFAGLNAARAQAEYSSALFAFGHHVGKLFQESGLAGLRPETYATTDPSERLRLARMKRRLMIAWGVGALLAIADGLVFAELGSSIPASGGSYIFLRECLGRNRWGRMMALVFVWQFLFSGTLDIATSSIGLNAIPAPMPSRVMLGRTSPRKPPSTGARANSARPAADSSSPVTRGGLVPHRMTSLADSPREKTPMIRLAGRKARPTSSAPYPSTCCR